jgi:hypothetical protein
MATLAPPKTNYLSKIIPKITGFHPIIKEKYDEEVNSWGKKNFLETPYLSDQTKIRGIKYFKPELGNALEEGVNTIRKADEITTNLGNKVTDLGNRYTLPTPTREQKKMYDDMYYSNLGGKRTRRNKTQKKLKRNFSSKLNLYSTPRTAQRMAYKYLGKTAKLYPSNNPAKKYTIFDPNNNKWVNFGQIGYEDYTKHHDKKRRKNYLTRTKSMRGNWKNNRYSANNLSRNILW